MNRHPLKFSNTTFCKQYHLYEPQHEGSSMRSTVDGLVLWKLLENQPIKTALEIGTYEGLTAGLLLERVENLHLTVIDLKRRYELFDSLLPQFNDNITFIEKNSNDVVLDQRFDLIFVDGGHEYDQVLSDIKNFSKLLKNTESLLIFDDYHWPGVRRAIDDCRNNILSEWVPFLQTQQLEFWQHRSKDRQHILNKFWTDPVKNFLWIYNDRDVYDNVILKIDTVSVFTSQIDFFRSVLDLYKQ